MRIGFDAKRIFRNRGGLGNYSRSTVELLKKYYPNNKYYLYSGFDDNRTGFEIPEGVEIVTPSTIIGDICPPAWRSLNMSHDVKKHKLDIYHGLSNELPYDIRLGGAKSVVSIHDLIFIHYPNLYRPIDRFLYTKKYKHSCQYADMVIAISEQTKNDLMEFWKIPEEQISVVKQGCNPIFYSAVSSEKREAVKKKHNLPSDYIISVGVIEERKNLMLTVHAMAEGNIDINLVACGKHTPYADTIMEYAVKKGIDNRIQFIHNVDTDDLPAIYQMAKVSVYVSLFEGFGIPILESLCSKVPVITSKGGVFHETGGDACIYVGQYDLEDMIFSLRRTIEDESLREDMILKGLNHADTFKDAIVAKNLMQVYTNLL